MADQFIQVPLDSGGKKVATSELVNAGGATVERQQVVISDAATAAGVAPVSTVAPAGTEAGLYVRIVSSGPGGGSTVDVTDRAARVLGHVTVDAGSAVIGHVIVDSAGAVSVTSLPSIPAGSAVIGHVIVDSGTIGISGTVTTDPTDRSGRLLGHVTVDTLPSLPSGSNVIGHIIVDSGSIALSAAIPAGSNVIGHVIVDSVTGTVTVAGTVAVSSVAGTVTTDPTDRVGRLLGHVTVDNATLAVTLASTVITDPADRPARQLGQVQVLEQAGIETLISLMKLQIGLLRGISYQLSFINSPRIEAPDPTVFIDAPLS